jgi:hypothetical protein
MFGYVGDVCWVQVVDVAVATVASAADQDVDGLFHVTWGGGGALGMKLFV